MKVRRLGFIAAVILFSGTMVSSTPKKVRIGLIVKSLGNSFFDACRDGGLEAAKEFGDVALIYQGPSTPTAEGQIEIIDALIAQRIDGLAISANDKDALIPVCQKALKRGIKVISFDSGIPPEGRILNLDPSGAEFIGRSQVKIMAEIIGCKGEIAVLSASSQATNQNTWIRWMKEALKEPKYKEMKLVSVVYGDDLSDKSYREAVGLFKSYPNLRGIISPTSVGIVAAGKAIEDARLKGKIELTGLGLPSQMKAYVKNGICKKMSLWNPVDLGYSAVTITYKLIKGEVKGGAGETMKIGRMGDIVIGESGNVVMAEPYVFTTENIDTFAAMY